MDNTKKFHSPPTKREVLRLNNRPSEPSSTFRPHNHQSHSPAYSTHSAPSFAVSRDRSRTDRPSDRAMLLDYPQVVRDALLRVGE